MPDIASDAVAFLRYTFDSAGDPKGTPVTHADVLYNAATIAEAIRVTSESVIVGWLPHLHDMGLVSGLLAFFAGASIVGMSPQAFLGRPARMLDAISTYRGTHVAAPNVTYDLIARRVTPAQLAGIDLSTWEAALNGAEPVRRPTAERITDLLAPAGFAPTVLTDGVIATRG